jgi:hypothetical protein
MTAIPAAESPGALSMVACSIIESRSSPPGRWPDHRFRLAFLSEIGQSVLA